MRKLREVLRLRFELHLGYQQIGRSCAIGVSTVCKYLQRAEAAGVSWPLPDGWDEAHLEAALFQRTVSPAKVKTPVRSQPDFATIHEQLRQHRHLTLQLSREEYRQAPRMVSIFALLRAISALALESRRGAATGVLGGRRLGRHDGSGRVSPV